MIEQYPDRKWTVQLIHHTHTDIGYTDHPRRISRYHSQIQRSVLEIVDAVRSGKKPEWKDFRWTVETFWSAEQFLERASAREKEAFAQVIREGFIGLSATYAHNSELLDAELLTKFIKRSVDYGRSIGVPIRSAMSADVNGFGWGYADALLENQIENLFTCIHTHHGLAPTGRRQNAFWWESASGRKLLVWNGEHYNIGNILGLAPGAAITYSFKDELHPNAATADTLPLAEKRLIRYLRQLEQDGYSHDFVPLMLSGLMTDNSPPSVRILEFARRWNELHGDRVRIEMTHLDAFFEKRRPELQGIPTYRGDWPDWWTDGVASVPTSTRIFRAAQRNLRLVREAQQNFSLTLEEARLAEVEQKLALYGEHTFHHCAVMEYPFDLGVVAQGGHKKSHAQSAYDLMVELLDEVQASRGEAPYTDVRRFRYKVSNFSKGPVQATAELVIDGMDYEIVEKCARVVDVESGQEVPYQKIRGPRSMILHVRVDLPAGGEKVFEIIPVPPTLSTIGSDFADHVLGDVQWEAPPVSKFTQGTAFLETAFLRLEWKLGEGLTEWIDKDTGESLLLKDRIHGPFTSVYERTPGDPHNGVVQQDVRRNMGRNRKGSEVIRSTAILKEVRMLNEGDLCVILQCLYEGAGAVFYCVNLKIWLDLPRVDVQVQMNKNSVWDAESLYVALPFTAGAGSVLWLDKAGGPLRPWIDQIPGTLADYYCIQDGFWSLGEKRGVVITTPDAPLLQLGPLAHGVRLTQGHPKLSEQPQIPYSWAMTNYWETNFEVSLGGFHEFRYSVQWGRELRNPEAALLTCRGLVNGVRTFRIY